MQRGIYCAATEAAVAEFQRSRGLHATGTCDQETWLALIEAGWRLGDRLLVLAAPQFRGDDVTDLQLSLNQLGFDCGRPDGIYGPATVRALSDFQRNCGLVDDGICGPTTVEALASLRRQTGGGPGVAAIRELQARSEGPASVVAARLVIGQFGGLSALARSVSRALRHLGATVMSTDEYDPRAQAAAANRFGAVAYLGFEARSEPCSIMSYFRVPQFESVGGHTLAMSLTEAIAAATAASPPRSGRPRLCVPTVEGMRLPVLRETRMPAVLWTVGPVRDVVDASPLLTDAVVPAVRRWLEGLGDRDQPAPA